MNGQNLAYITNLKIEDVPWSRLTTTYGRVSRFPEIFKQLSAAIGKKDLAQSLTTSKSNSGQIRQIQQITTKQNLTPKPFKRF